MVFLVYTFTDEKKRQRALHDDDETTMKKAIKVIQDVAAVLKRRQR